jgi:hypothetical protein
MYDLEPVTFIMSFLFMAALSAPFIYYGQQTKKKNTTLISKLKELAQAKSAIPTELEIWRSRFGLGLDYHQKVLVYVKTGTAEAETVLQLSEFEKVNLIKNFGKVVGKTQSNKLPEFIALEFIPKLPHCKPISLEVYDALDFSDLQGETVLADKWFEILKKQLN